MGPAKTDNLVENAGTVLLLAAILPHLSTSPKWKPPCSLLQPTCLLVANHNIQSVGGRCMEKETGTPSWRQTTELDLKRFGQWLTEHQTHLMREMVHQQQKL